MMIHLPLVLGSLTQFWRICRLGFFLLNFVKYLKLGFIIQFCKRCRSHYYMKQDLIVVYQLIIPPAANFMRPWHMDLNMNLLISLLRTQRTVEVGLLAALDADMRAQALPSLVETSTLATSNGAVDHGRHAPPSSPDGRLRPRRGI